MSRKSLLQRKSAWNQIMGGINHCGLGGKARSDEYKKRLNQFRDVWKKK